MTCGQFKAALFDMSNQDRVDELVLELLDSGRTPEEICDDCPELLAKVRSTWLRVRAVDAEISSILPDSNGYSEPLVPFDGELPQITGYEMQRVLGRGGVAIVYLARHVRLERLVAVKMLLAGQHAKPRELDRFSREARTLAELHHANIVQIFDVGEYNGCPYFTMEYLNGGRLVDRVKERPMPAKDAARMIATFAEAIHVAHQSGIIHRDLTPSNILVTTDGVPKITDFGLARHLHETGGLTFTGAALGTPGYMAPEQADRRVGEIGPAADVYALGAILYKLLTGRPPFQAETTASTIRQLLFNEPLPVSKLNPSIPRDLETICLKCLSKEPEGRYATAASLADDVRRFERGEPIVARPVGRLGRVVQWARRRPALAVALATGMMLAFALVATVLWWQVQRTALEATAVAYAEADLSESDRLRDKGEFGAAAAVLERAKDRLREFVPPELAERLSAAFDNLELVTRLDEIRLERALIKPPAGLLSALVVPIAEGDGQKSRGDSLSARHYEQAFRKARIGAQVDNLANVAAHVQASRVSAALVSALDDWAACAVNREQQAWILEVARRADPDPWRDRVRDPKTWENSDVLRDLAASAPVDKQSPKLLAVLGARLRARNIDADAFLTRVASAYPADFWANIEMGNALHQKSSWLEAIGFYRTALALRPQTLSLRYGLGDLYLNLKRWDEAIAEYEQAVALDPENAWCHNRLGFAFAWKGGRDDEAIAHTREAVRIDPNEGWFHYCLGFAFDRNDRLDEAVAEFREATRLLPQKRAEWRRDLSSALLRRGRGAEARVAWKEDLTTHPPAPEEEWWGYAELSLFLGDESEYYRARRELLAKFGTLSEPISADRVARACLLLPVSRDELRDAIALSDRAVGRDARNPYFLFTRGLARYRQGRFDEAIELVNGEAANVLGPSPRLLLAMAQYQKGEKDRARNTLAAAIASYDWDPAKADAPDAWLIHNLRRVAEALISKDLPASRDDK